MLKIPIYLLLFLGLPSLAFGQSYFGKTKDIDQIKANTLAFSQAYMDGDTEKLVACYTEDGKIFPGGAPILAGRKDLMKYWKPAPGSKVLFHKVSPVEVRVVKKYAYDFGFYEGKSENANGEVSAWRGKYVIVWRKVGKEWKIYLDIWNK